MEQQIYSPVMLILLFSIMFFTFIVKGNLSEKYLNTISSFIVTILLSPVILITFGFLYLVFSLLS